MRGSEAGESHGGAYLIDLNRRRVDKPIDWNRTSIDWRGHGGDRGLRGIAFDNETVFIAASDELLGFRPDFSPVGIWRNAYLKHCHEICVYERTLFLASTAFDCVLAFDLDKRRFVSGFHIETSDFRFKARGFDPNGDDGPLQLEKLHINSIFCNRHGMYLGGSNSGGMLHFNGKTILMAAQLLGRSHNARPFRDGVLFNDNSVGRLRYCGRGDGAEDRALAPPRYNPKQLIHAEFEDSGVTRQGFLRGLCRLGGAVVAGGSTPATVAVYDLAANERLLSVNLSRDLRTAVHSIAVWPYD